MPGLGASRLASVLWSGHASATYGWVTEGACGARKSLNLSGASSTMFDVSSNPETVPEDPNEAGSSGPPSSLLVHNRRSLRKSDDGCPAMRGFVFVSTSTGSVVPASCQTNGCPWCGVRRAKATAVAVDLREPERMVTLTLVGDSAKTTRARLSRLRYDLRSVGYRWEEWGAIERNPEGTGFHYHGYQRGDFVPVKALSEAADYRGMGKVVDIRRLRSLRGRGPLYATKAASAYGVKGADGFDQLQEWLHLNGGRHGIWSRGFFGEPYNDALRAALGRSERDGHDPGPWVLRGTAGGIGGIHA